MNFLILDTSSAYCSIALRVKDKTYSNTKYIPRQHNKFLLEMIKKIFESAGIDKKNLDFIAYGVGPGSFVGVRLAAAVAQAFAVGLDIPILGFSSMFAIAKSTPINSDKVAVILDAKMGDFYLGLYNKKMDDMISENVYKLQEYSTTLHAGFSLIGEAIEQIELVPQVTNFKLDVSDLTDYLYRQYLLQKQNSRLTQETFPVYLRGNSHWNK
ncbi:tRNA (adenosine(37)-N6)-threonylcarbamoyltransferase complex dimerization subunit type 1 TsaB [Allofrancisella guangzhouensis]|uniref:tRNA threonylcarbamoyladenosine biosynthesis protein TsaB n=1 Tax=Allofrancisella guangzhouensis TaxID=594679 RepID=A0A0A8E6D9_9GAMM|nr:tRNA (adenosine(37)-N6)-threonylcarbamoyltransferase complex dimerization subunit type 1 TsaB [Allofrancisella guangzhouensis]AJC49137.1 glycoprotease [Allofrancisella guangzhouensis]MBK2026854.1 tRNA (adenosine(37)-N6)-threonylcarbamoyltransferase complex dimerization subunit type 1 TsaB [Allofrancisella guangzhouensis]MBK2043604.1 tRNA (adenosine(37)-N6)-threonylcarbamoyltransferase complex dimerization subunit type 1 TsaB [Allofrancisella guangzhouensis]MBK2046351.1 tRNA (adenosine(37)-N6